MAGILLSEAEIDDIGSIVDRISDGQGNVLVAFIPVGQYADDHELHMPGYTRHFIVIVPGAHDAGHSRTVVGAPHVELSVSVYGIQQVIRIIPDDLLAVPEFRVQPAIQVTPEIIQTELKSLSIHVIAVHVQEKDPGLENLLRGFPYLFKVLLSKGLFAQVSLQDGVILIIDIQDPGIALDHPLFFFHFDLVFGFYLLEYPEIVQQRTIRFVLLQAFKHGRIARIAAGESGGFHLQVPAIGIAQEVPAMDVIHIAVAIVVMAIPVHFARIHPEGSAEVLMIQGRTVIHNSYDHCISLPALKQVLGTISTDAGDAVVIWVQQVPGSVLLSGGFGDYLPDLPDLFPCRIRFLPAPESDYFFETGNGSRVVCQPAVNIAHVGLYYRFFRIDGLRFAKVDQRTVILLE